jgi:transposase
LYFESNNEDDLRKKGYSKDHKNDLPQILVGLFVDKNGYPFDFDFYEGSIFEGHAFPKAIKALTTKYQFKDLAVVADAGMLSEKNILFLEQENLSYIVGARLKNLSGKTKKQILANNFTKKKTIELISQIKLVTGEIKDKRLIVDYQDKRAKKDKFNRERIIKKLRAKIAFKKELVKKSKYLIFENQSKVVGIDQKKIKIDQQYDGLKGYWTNLNIETKPVEIIDQYHNLWKVEKAFRMSKGDLAERPIFHRRIKRIESHILICFVSLLVMKETERILNTKNISLIKTIEILGKVGQGETKIGKLKLPIESELNQEARTILQLF